MVIPPYAQQDFLGLGSERQDARLPADGEPAPASASPLREGPAPSGVPPFASFRLAGRVAPFVLLLALVGCDGPPEPAPLPARRAAVMEIGPDLYEVHLAERAVTCWTTMRGGVSCLPDSQVRGRQ